MVRITYLNKAWSEIKVNTDDIEIIDLIKTKLDNGSSISDLFNDAIIGSYLSFNEVMLGTEEEIRVEDNGGIETIVIYSDDGEELYSNGKEIEEMTISKIKQYIKEGKQLRWEDPYPITNDLNYYNIINVFCDSDVEDPDNSILIHYGNKDNPSEAQVYLNEIILV